MQNGLFTRSNLGLVSLLLKIEDVYEKFVQQLMLETTSCSFQFGNRKNKKKQSQQKGLSQR